VIVSLVLLAFVVPVLAGPLAYCLEGDDGSRVVAAASHCESMADATATAKPAAPEHLPAIDESVSAASGSAGWALVIQSCGLLVHDDGVAFTLSDLLPARLDAYGGDGADRCAMRSLAGAIAGRSARLQI
jgi:hypothetical protein